MDDRGVSPVIATILMVAITVVLAAVLYLMVANFTGGSTEALDYVGSVTIDLEDDDTTYLRFQRIMPVPAPTDLFLLVEFEDDTTVTEYRYSWTSMDSGALDDEGGAGWSFFYNDVAENRLINKGDWITMDQLDPGFYIIKLISVDSGTQILERSWVQDS